MSSKLLAVVLFACAQVLLMIHGVDLMIWSRPEAWAYAAGALNGTAVMLLLRPTQDSGAALIAQTAEREREEDHG